MDLPRTYLTNAETAKYLRLSPRTLEKMRGLGNGPHFCKFGRRVLYEISEVDAWAAGRTYEMTAAIVDEAQTSRSAQRRNS
jgi:hypothetical protein